MVDKIIVVRVLAPGKDFISSLINRSRSRVPEQRTLII